MRQTRLHSPFFIVFILVTSIFTIQCSSDKSKEVLEGQLTEILGGSSTILPTYLSKLKANMDCASVKAVYPSMTDCDPEKKFNEFKLPIKDHPILEKMEISVYKGKLDRVELYFNKTIHESFKEASLKVIEAKWGKVTPEEKRTRDTVSRVISTKPGFFNIKRQKVMDQWLFDFNFRRFKN